jgi:type VI secretion system secreted protein Hcp
MSQADYYLKIDGVDGESVDEKHKGEIELESFSWGESNSGRVTGGAGGGTGKVNPQDITISKYVDKSSPMLFLSCAVGSHFKSAILTSRKQGQGGQQEYLKVKLEDLLVTSYQVAGGQGGGKVTDHFTLNFAKMYVSYFPQKQDGSLGAEVKQAYDFAVHKKL